jgi:predicted O-methyltransferase YrrM
MEGLIIAYIVETVKPMKIFEIGTYDGFSTYHLAMNGHPLAEIYTINLPMEEGHSHENIKRLSWFEYFGDNSTHAVLKKSRIGDSYKRCPQSKKVKQLFGDTLTYDFSRFKEKIDLCFIDGGHSYECLVKDTANAMDMLSEHGLIIWHDFNMQHRDIYRFMMGFSRHHKLFWISDTRLVLYCKGYGL